MTRYETDWHAWVHALAALLVDDAQIPAACPWHTEQVLDADIWPDTP